LKYAAIGMHVIIVDINQEALDAAVKSIKGVTGVGEVWGLKVDVSKIDEVVAMREKVFEEFGEVCSPHFYKDIKGTDIRSMYSWQTLVLARPPQPCPLLSPLRNYRVIGELYFKPICLE
jgi:NAD(P)-dependent dehydrogenase (short-subunit alcohol dehydrogenase family)